MEDPTRTFAAAANPQRLSILKLLADQKQVAFTDILRKLGFTPGNLGFHLKELVDANLVEKRNGDAYVLTDLGLSLMVWAGKTQRRDLRAREMREHLKYIDSRYPLRRYSQTPGRDIEWLGGIIVVVGIGALLMGASALVIGILIGAGCATAFGGASLNYLAGTQALKMLQSKPGKTEATGPRP